MPACSKKKGKVSLASVRGPGFGYRVEEIKRDLRLGVQCEG